MDLAPLYLRYRTVLEWSYWPSVWSLQALVAATSVLMEYGRRGEALATWEPFVWEFSSVATSLVGLLLILAFDRRFPLSGRNPLRSSLAHFGFSLVFSAVHVLGMVALRKGAYLAFDRSYDFGNWPLELIYEYRKDLLTYASILITVYVYRYLRRRILGEATRIGVGEDDDGAAQTDRLLVKKLGREFLIRIDDIEWIEAAGNYMNLHVGGRIYPLRETMTGLECRLDSQTFVRVHRSYMVNVGWISEISVEDSGDATITLRSGAKVRASRRYREGLRSALTGT